MTDAQRVALLALLFLALNLGTGWWLVATANRWASDDMHVGHGSVSFPPQGGARR